MDFEFHVGGIEDGILDLLEEKMKPLGVKTFATYSGELDSDNLKAALGALTPNFPLIMVSYTDGVDTEDPKTGKVLNKSLHFRHDCSFLVICVSNDARGETARRRGKLVGTQKLGTYKLLSVVRETLSGLRMKTFVDDAEVILNHQPFMPAGIEHIKKIPNCTAYAAIFDTYFRFSTPDRSIAGQEISEYVVGVNSLNNPQQPTGNVPGTIFK